MTRRNLYMFWPAQKSPKKFRPICWWWCLTHWRPWALTLLLDFLTGIPKSGLVDFTTPSILLLIKLFNFAVLSHQCTHGWHPYIDKYELWSRDMTPIMQGSEVDDRPRGSLCSASYIGPKQKLRASSSEKIANLLWLDNGHILYCIVAWLTCNLCVVILKYQSFIRHNWV